MENTSLSDALISLIPTYGPWTIFGIVALESAGVSLPGETMQLRGRDLGLVRTPVSRMGRLLLPGLCHGATMTEPAASVRKRRVFQLLHEGRFAGKSLMILVAAKRWTPLQAGKGITAAIQISIISECRYRWLHVLDLNLRRFWSV
jgi:hypothetical protein